MVKGVKWMSLLELSKYSGKHYDFYFAIDSVAEKDILKISKNQENCYKEICDFLGVTPSFKIQYFLLETPELVGRVYGDNDPCNGFASFPDKVYAVYNEEIKCIGYHEDTHIISNLLNKPDSLFLSEGLAMYFDKTWWDRSNEEWVSLFIQNGKYIQINKLIRNDIFLSFSDEITYPIAGALTKYLIDRYGKDLYLLMYGIKNSDLLDTIQQVYSEKLENIEREFIESLSNNVKE